MIVGDRATGKERLRLLDLIAEHSRLTQTTLQSEREPTAAEIRLSKKQSRMLAHRIDQLYEHYDEE